MNIIPCNLWEVTLFVDSVRSEPVSRLSGTAHVQQSEIGEKTDVSLLSSFSAVKQNIIDENFLKQAYCRLEVLWWLSVQFPLDSYC